jgi:hypothetical protein
MEGFYETLESQRDIRRTNVHPAADSFRTSG